jgi:hypothetical protein
MPGQYPPPTLVIDEDDVLIREGEEQVQPFQEELATAHRRILVLARGLAAAKRKYPNTVRFGVWLATSPYDRLGATARAALIKLGENEAEAEPILSSTSSASPELIWNEVKAARVTSETRNSSEDQPAGNQFIESLLSSIGKIPSDSIRDKVAQVANGDGTRIAEIVTALHGAIERLNHCLDALSTYGEPGEEEDIHPRRLN